MESDVARLNTSFQGDRLRKRCGRLLGRPSLYRGQVLVFDYVEMSLVEFDVLYKLSLKQRGFIPRLSR